MNHAITVGDVGLVICIAYGLWRFDALLMYLLKIWSERR